MIFYQYKRIRDGVFDLLDAMLTVILSASATTMTWLVFRVLRLTRVEDVNIEALGTIL